MEKFLTSLNNSLDNNNWHAALFIALALPDICGKMENPNGNVGPRYRDWCKQYLEPKYTHLIGADQSQHIFLSASDCYALRCAFLHEGADDITEQNAREALDKFHFIEPPKSGSVHCNQSNQTLQLQVDIFCRDILSGAEQWLDDNKDNNEIKNRIDNLITIYASNNISF